MGQAAACSGPGLDPQSGQVSWVRFFWGFSLPVRQMSGSFRPPRSPNIIWPSLSPIVIHYGHQWPEMLTCPKTSNIQILGINRCSSFPLLSAPHSLSLASEQALKYLKISHGPQRGGKESEFGYMGHPDFIEIHHRSWISVPSGLFDQIRYPEIPVTLRPLSW